MNISIIIPYSGKFNLLQNNLDSLIPQLDEHDEILIINDSLDDSIDRIMRYPVSVYELRGYGRAMNNMVAARNYGAVMAHNEILIFLDEDVSLKKRTLECYRIDVAKYGIVFGQIQWLRKDGTMSPDYRVLKMKNIVNGTGQANELSNYGMGGGGNFGILKTIFFSVNGFSEEFNGRKYHEDIDLMRKLISNKHDIYYSYNARAIHQWHPVNHTGLEENTQRLNHKWGKWNI